MLYIPKTDDCLEILKDEEVKDFVAKNFSETIMEEQNLRKVAKSLYIFLTTPDEVQSSSFGNYVHHWNVESLNLFDPELRLINTKPVIDKKLKELLSDLRKLNVQKTLLLDYKKKNDCKMLHSSDKLIADHSDIDGVFGSTHQSIMTKLKSYVDKDWIVLDVIVKHGIKIFEC